MYTGKLLKHKQPWRKKVMVMVLILNINNNTNKTTSQHKPRSLDLKEGELPGWKKNK